MDRNDKEKQEYKLRPGWKSSHLDKEKPNCGRQSIDATPENASPWYLVVLHMSTSVICASKYPSYCILHHPPDIQLQCRRTFHLVWRKHISDITNTKDSKWSFCWPVSTLEAGFRSSAQDRIINARLSFNGFFHSLAIKQENVQHLKKITLHKLFSFLLYESYNAPVIFFFFGGGGHAARWDKSQLFPKHFDWDYYLELPPSTMQVDHLNLEFKFTLKSWWSRINQKGYGFLYIFGVWS